ncbi:hypothetical protein CRG98_007727 [Punica granatum]|uniref:Uncharacterized protein n=1 Tax=Punica granatum TaxID=22663 RepID=A0A2I0KTT3_PUNGR|nr:hypothetical protein CRG98_007727 [Punica granatum]
MLEGALELSPRVGERVGALCASRGAGSCNVAGQGALQLGGEKTIGTDLRVSEKITAAWVPCEREAAAGHFNGRG